MYPVICTIYYIKSQIINKFHLILLQEKSNLSEKLSESQYDYNKLYAEHDDYSKKVDRERETTGQVCLNISHNLHVILKFLY